jgi:hypothetical protein
MVLTSGRARAGERTHETDEHTANVMAQQGGELMPAGPEVSA